MRRVSLLLLALIGAADASPKGGITLHVKNASLQDVATQLSAASPCRVIPLGVARVTLSLDNKSLWEVLARLETDANVSSTIEHGMINLNDTPRSNLSWANDWRTRGPWAIAYAPGAGGLMMTRGGVPAVTDAHLSLIGLQPYKVEKIVVERAVAGRKPFKVTAKLPMFPPMPCDTVTIGLELDVPPTTQRVSVRGYIVAEIPSTQTRRVEVPFDDSVVDLAEGRLRIHVASRPSSGGREIYVGWDSLGDQVTIGVKIVDERDLPIQSSGGGSGSGGSQGHRSIYTTWTSGKRYAILTLPSGVSTRDKIPFRFDNMPVKP